jgi:uncharacterized protein YndB with AHSA1/START domain
MDGPDVIRLERRIGAPPATVFRYLTRPELWSRWQGEAAELDPRPGGLFRIRMAAGQVVEGSYREVEPNARVVVTWGWRGHPRMPAGTTTVEFELVADGEGTLLRLTHRGLPHEDLPLHLEGWGVFLPRLGAAASGDDPGPNPA